MVTTERTNSKNASGDKHHTKVKLQGGRYSGTKVRVYPENLQEVRRGKEAPVYADLTIGDQVYEAITDGGKPVLIAR